LGGASTEQHRHIHRRPPESCNQLVRYCYYEIKKRTEYQAQVVVETLPMTGDDKPLSGDSRWHPGL
jgi:hypothetical protein